jgi:uncharacterized protein YecE (DUF72 family)
MKFGKLDSLEGVDFSLPPDHPQTARQWAKPRQGGGMEVYFGCPAWGCKDWVGKIYPPKTPAGAYLRHYARQFNTIELNATHYRVPTAEVLAQWKASVPEGFRFCPKVPQQISHRAHLLEGLPLLESFAEAMLLLGEALGISFLQLPPYFGPDRLPELRQFLERWPAALPLAVEFRHEGWFDGRAQADEAFEALEAWGMMTVITDVAGRRDVLHQRLTGKTAVVRLVGNGLHHTDFSRLDAWMARWSQWRDQGLERLYCWLHEPDEVYGPEYAAAFVERANRQWQMALQGPKIQPSPIQTSLF